MSERYVCGFALCEDGTVLLIEKQRPEWQRGRWNGIGGHIEPGESDLNAMRREFSEETGLLVQDGWEHFATLRTDHGSEVVFFRIRLTYGHKLLVRQTTDERPEWWHVFGLPNTIPNLRWLVPMALHETYATGMPLLVAERDAPNGGAA